MLLIEHDADYDQHHYDQHGQQDEEEDFHIGHAALFQVFLVLPWCFE